MELPPKSKAHAEIEDEEGDDQESEELELDDREDTTLADDDFVFDES